MVHFIKMKAQEDFSCNYIQHKYNVPIWNVRYFLSSDHVKKNHQCAYSCNFGGNWWC